MVVAQHGKSDKGLLMHVFIALEPGIHPERWVRHTPWPLLGPVWGSGNHFQGRRDQSEY